MRPARAGARCFGGAQRPGNEDVFTDEVGFCLFGSHYEPRFVCGLGSGDNKTTMGSPMEAGGLTLPWIRHVLSFTCHKVQIFL